jgi:exonuclease SbcC
MEDIPQARIDVEAALRDAHNTLDQHDSHVNELTTEREQLTEKIADLRGQMVDLSSKDELERREVEYNDLVKDIETSGTRFSELKDIDEEVRQLNDELAVLKNPRERQAIAQNTVNKRGTLATNRQQQQELADTAQSEYETVQEKLKAYATLDANLEAARTQRDDHAEGYHLYVENKKTAELLNERTERLNDVQAKLAEETDKRDEYVQECDKLAKDFDVEHYVALQEEHRELETIQTELRAESKHLSEKLSETETEIDKLHAIVAQIKTLQEIGKRLTEEQMTFEFVRKSIRDAGPRIRKRKVQLVSEVAANYFSEIINDFTMRLQWDADDYGIHLEQGGETRPFGVLSGGEQMIAALAVRLALLTHMTQVRLIFLDEPTINLDKNRRIQLAERLSTIKGLKQLFVISHDDTFIGDSNHVINVIKEDEISRVEMSHATLY